MNNNEVGLHPEMSLKVRTRLHVLYSYVYEMAEAFGADESCLESIEKGIHQRHIIREIIIKYRNEDRVVLGKVIISVDWEQHYVLASTDDGKSFNLNPDKSIRSQISEVADIIIDHVNCLRNSLPIKYITTSYRYVDDIEKDKEKNESAMSFFFFFYASKPDSEYIQEEFTHTIEYIAKHMKEVCITVLS